MKIPTHVEYGGRTRKSGNSSGNLMYDGHD